MKTRVGTGSGRITGSGVPGLYRRKIDEKFSISYRWISGENRFFDFHTGEFPAGKDRVSSEFMIRPVFTGYRRVTGFRRLLYPTGKYRNWTGNRVLIIEIIFKISIIIWKKKLVKKSPQSYSKSLK